LIEGEEDNTVLNSYFLILTFMKVLKPEQLEKKVFERMNEYPPGWRVFYTVNKKEQLSTGIINRELNEQYWLKFLSPYSLRVIGFESSFDEGFGFLDDPYFDKDFGFRPIKISKREMEKYRKTGKIISSLSRKIEEATRKSPEPYDDSSIVGPYPVFPIENLGDISPAQSELEAKMDEEIERLDKRNLKYIV